MLSAHQKYGETILIRLEIPTYENAKGTEKDVSIVNKNSIISVKVDHSSLQKIYAILVSFWGILSLYEWTYNEKLVF